MLCAVSAHSAGTSSSRSLLASLPPPRFPSFLTLGSVWALGTAPAAISRPSFARRPSTAPAKQPVHPPFRSTSWWRSLPTCARACLTCTARSWASCTGTSPPPTCSSFTPTPSPRTLGKTRRGKIPLPALQKRTRKGSLPTSLTIWGLFQHPWRLASQSMFLMAPHLSVRLSPLKSPCYGQVPCSPGQWVAPLALPGQGRRLWHRAPHRTHRRATPRQR